MTKNFEELFSLLREEGLFDEGQGRVSCQVRLSGGTLQPRQHLHLWADRAEADAFLQRLLKRSNKDWQVCEEDVI